MIYSKKSRKDNNLADLLWDIYFQDLKRIYIKVRVQYVN